MNRTIADKIESNVNSLKSLLDDYYRDGYEDDQAVRDLVSEIFRQAHGFDVADREAERYELGARLATALRAAERLAAALLLARQYVAKHVADTESAIAQRTLDKIEAALADWKAARKEIIGHDE